MHGPLAVCGRLAVTVGAAVLAALAPALPARAGALGCAEPSLNDRCESWSAVYDDPSITSGSSDQLEPRIAATADGSRVFVAAIDEAFDRNDPYNAPASWAVLAYDGQSGAQQWSATYSSAGHYDRPNAIAVSPDGRVVYATGGSYDAPVLVAKDRDMVTIAYDTASGRELWRTRNSDPSVHDVGTEVLPSRDGREVYAVANIAAANGEIDWAAVAYDALDGHVLWRTEYDGVVQGSVNSPAGMALSPDGGLVYVTGQSGTPTQYDLDYATVAYATGGATPGAVVWSSRYDGVGRHWPDRPSGIAVDLAGRVLVTGDSISDFSVKVADDYATVAYDGRSGAQLWASRYSGPAGGVQFGMAVAASAVSDLAVVTGQIEPGGTAGHTGWGTLAYDTRTGAQLWAQTLDTPGYSSQFPVAAAITRDGRFAVVTGYTGARGATPVSAAPAGGEAVTVAYDLSSGAQQWIARYTAALSDTDTPRALAIGDDGTVFTTAQVSHDQSTGGNASNHYDVVTLAYHPATPAPVVPEGPPVWLLAGGAAAALLLVRRHRSRA